MKWSHGSGNLCGPAINYEEKPHNVRLCSKLQSKEMSENQ